MITFPMPPKRHWVSALWWVLSALFPTVGGALTFALGLPGGAVVGVLAGAALSVAGIARPPLRWTAYRLWNKVARKLSDLVAGLVTGLLFFVVTVAGRGGSSFLLGAPSGSESSWTPKTSVRPEDFASQSDGPGRNRGSWRGAYLSWGLTSGRLWIWCLYPLIATLGLLQTREQGSFGGNVYTLY